MTAVAITRIERVSHFTIGALADQLPPIPAEVFSLAWRPGRRLPTEIEMAGIVWTLAWDGDTIVGVLGYRDGFDFHTATDVREIIYLSGPATLKLLEWAREGSEHRIIGALDIENHRFNDAAATLGFRKTRVLWEDC